MRRQISKSGYLDFFSPLPDVRLFPGFEHHPADNPPMHLDLDPESLRVSMSLWRDAIDLKTPLKDEFKIHFMARRQEILCNMTNTATAWKMFLHACKTEDQAQLTALLVDIEAFKKWADQGLAELQAIAQGVSK